MRRGNCESGRLLMYGWCINVSLYEKSGFVFLYVFGFLIATIVRPIMLAPWGMLQSGTNSKAFHFRRPFTSYLMASWVLCVVYVGSNFKGTSVIKVGYTYEVLLWHCMVSMSWLRSGLLAEGGIGDMYFMLRSLVCIPSVMYINFGVVFITTKGTFFLMGQEKLIFYLLVVWGIFYGR